MPFVVAGLFGLGGPEVATMLLVLSIPVFSIGVLWGKSK
jgi:hypothetical protein